MVEKTHILRPTPRVTARHLADFMGATDPGRRTIAKLCKFTPRAPLLQHEEARSTVGKFIRDRDSDVGWLTEEASRLRARIADTQFERDEFDNNADYIDRFAKVFPGVVLPKAELFASGEVPNITINGVVVSVDLAFRLRRTTKTNQVRVGAAMLRYGKNRPLSPTTGAWQSAFVLGYLRELQGEGQATPEGALCIVLDCWTGSVHGAPTDAVRRWKQMSAACETIAEWWPGIKPPPGAIL